MTNFSDLSYVYSVESYFDHSAISFCYNNFVVYEDIQNDITGMIIVIIFWVYILKHCVSKRGHVLEIFFSIRLAKILIKNRWVKCIGSVLKMYI